MENDGNYLKLQDIYMKTVKDVFLTGREYYLNSPKNNNTHI